MIGSQELSQSYPSILASGTFICTLIFGPVAVTHLYDKYRKRAR